MLLERQIEVQDQILDNLKNIVDSFNFDKEYKQLKGNCQKLENISIKCLTGINQEYNLQNIIRHKFWALYFGKYSKFSKHIYIVKTKIFHTFSFPFWQNRRKKNLKIKKSKKIFIQEKKKCLMFVLFNIKTACTKIKKADHPNLILQIRWYTKHSHFEFHLADEFWFNGLILA
ncbi:hypothetical protein BpHYR1_003547 [Brachionus plicatilis]|uniref:Uncharacterized protein n=1 Tax=Brachionus plicatilis TaxID=10195 RepID=A0A3M7QDL5_BRAPC|nr:hypothetical protein BpHYR1_003547 [Brachionus plicatilis]